VEDVERLGVAAKDGIRKFNEISRTFYVEISEINFSHMGSNKQGVRATGKALKMQGNMDGCTIEAGRCIQ
jgi:hypothetical protein